MTFDLEKVRALTSDLNDQIADLMQNCNSLRARARKAEAEIERMRADNAGLSKAVIDIQEERDLAQAEFRSYHRAWEEQAARIQELEDALVEASAWRRMEEHNEFSSIGGPEIKDLVDFLDEARQQLRAEGKIGPDASKSHLRPYEVVAADLAGMMAKSWRITDERRRAIAILMVASNPEKIGNFDFEEEEAARAVLRSMLQEAGQ